MARRSSPGLRRVLEHMARLSPPRHRELVRGMVAELDAIADSAERRRFALGAIAAIAQLTLSGAGRTAAKALGRFLGIGEEAEGVIPGGPIMSNITTRHLLRRHVLPFAVSLTSLTLLLLANSAAGQLRRLSARGLPDGTLGELVLLSVPHILALTMPMAVFLAVAWVFTRLGREGVLASAKREHHGVRRLVAPVLVAAAVIAGLTLISNTQILPRANGRIVEVLTGAPGAPSDREMTVGELRAAAEAARTASGPAAARRAAGYEVEIQKKFALAAACLFLALAGAVTGIRFPQGGLKLVVGASAVVFTVYYVSLVAGESLAEGQGVPPLLAMWMANAVLLAVTLALVWPRSRHGPSSEAETLAIDG